MAKRLRPVYFVGMHKAKIRSSACLIDTHTGREQIEIFLNERLTRQKAHGGPYIPGLKPIAARVDERRALLAENTYDLVPLAYERQLNEEMPYFEYLQKMGLQLYTRQFNSRLKVLTHHYCHAMAAVKMSPFERSILVVFDGGGNMPEVFPRSHSEFRLFSPGKRRAKGESVVSESCTVYLQDRARLTPVHKEWSRRRSKQGRFYEDGLGRMYEMAAVYAFNELLDAGKVMGLAPFGKPSTIRDRMKFLRGLDWTRAFKGKGKRDWEKCGRFQHFADIAASVQKNFEDSVIDLLKNLRGRYPQYSNLILTGGCALNCVTNMRVVREGLFERVYVPPFPGDESISLGAAAHLQFHDAGARWQPRDWNEQVSYFGPLASVPRSRQIESEFRGFRVRRLEDVYAATAQLLSRGKVVAWFQGRSESGPRALGNRSILADPRVAGMQAYLNDKIKGRESFRPYGASCLWEKAHVYFDVPQGFESPFMSFAPLVRQQWRDELASATHIDGTSRIQTVRKRQNPRFHRLLERFGSLTGVYCLLNTSLNVMGEPIVETISDARRFFEKTPVDALVISDYLIERRA